MYGSLFRALPGPAWLRAGILVLAALAVLASLFVWGFPALDATLNNPALEGGE